ncbi:MAG TPA: glycosyltransferase family 9 protein [Stellaceae bacterium]|nr:glycosyltransferase family 9 protein [Stellaceae bacterium]
MAAPRILVIKLGALGDIVQALGPMAAIRRHHADAHVVLLTSAPFAEFLRGSPYADEVWVDRRPRLLDLPGILRLRRRLRGGGFARVYDLQTSDRSSFYYCLLGPGARPEWSGIARGASHRQGDPGRERMHTLERQRDQLRIAGIAEVPPPDLSWVKADLRGFDLPERFAVLIPGGAAHRPEKRWPVERYAALAAWLRARGVTPVTIGGEAERPLGAAIPASRDLTGRTSFVEVAAIGRRALWAIGSDTGPMHLMVAAGAPATVLFSAASDPALTAPRGGRVTILRRERLADLPVEEVAATVAIG